MKESEKKIGYAKLYVKLCKIISESENRGAIYFKHCKTIMLAN